MSEKNKAYNNDDFASTAWLNSVDINGFLIILYVLNCFSAGSGSGEERTVATNSNLPSTAVESVIVLAFKYIKWKFGKTMSVVAQHCLLLPIWHTCGQILVFNEVTAVYSLL